MHLDCGSCVIRSWRIGDEEKLVHQANDREVWLNLRDRFPYPYSHSDAEQWIQFASTRTPETDFAIVTSEGVVGGIGLTLGDDVERCSAEVGYWLGREAWGRGIATVALRGFTAHAFAAYTLTRLYALPFGANAASIRVLEKAGFLNEGRLRRSAIKNGLVQDQIMYALTDEDLGLSPRSG